MTHSYGKRSGTRYKFARDFKRHGMPTPSTYIKTFKRGEYVTIKINGAIQRGLTTGFYHGRTGRVFDITPTSVGVIIAKRVRNRQILKRVHVRREHVMKSNSLDEFISRRASNDAKARENAASGKKEKICYKRLIHGPRPACIIRGEVKEFSPVPFTESF